MGDEAGFTLTREKYMDYLRKSKNLDKEFGLGTIYAKDAMDKFASNYEKQKAKLKETYHERKAQDPDHWAFLQQKGKDAYERTKARKVGLLQPRGRGRPKKSESKPEIIKPEDIANDEAEVEMMTSLPPPMSIREISMMRSKELPTRRNRLVRTPSPLPIDDSDIEPVIEIVKPRTGYAKINNLF